MISSLKSGFAQMWTNKRMVFIFFATNFMFGLLLMLPGRAALSGFASQTLMGQKLAGRFSFDFLFDFIRENGTIIDVYTVLFMIVPAVYWLFGLVLSGGAFAMFKSGEKFSAGDFWWNCGKYFGRFARLLLLSLPVFGVLLLLQFVWAGLERLFWGSDPYQYITYWGAWVKFGLRTISILLFGLVLDYSRIYTVIADEKRMRISLWRGIRCAFTNLGQTFGLALTLFLAGVVVLAFYNPIADSLSAPNGFVIFTLFLAQQLYMFWRMMLRLTLYSSQMHLYQRITDGVTLSTAERSDDVGLEGTPA